MKPAFDRQTFTLQSYGGISIYFARLVQGLYIFGKFTLTRQAGKLISIGIGSANNISSHTFRKKPIIEKIPLIISVFIRAVLKSITDRLSNRIRGKKW